METITLSNDQSFIECRRMPEGWWFANVVDAPGAWGNGATQIAAIDQCIEVWREWLTI